MERIEINGFLTIDHADFEIRKINILIGAQAQGKSVIAKLVYFFKNFFPAIFIPSVQEFETKREIERKCLAQFEEIFPRYSWINQEFSIIYTNGNYEVSIARTKAGNKYILKFNYCKELVNFHKELNIIYKRTLDELEARQVEQKYRSTLLPKEWILHQATSEKIKNSIFSKADSNPIFIPASRSFFANLQKNIFSFLANDIDIDPLIKEFGSHYENSKHMLVGNTFLVDDIFETIEKKISNLVSEVIAGEYTYEEKQDWILNNGRRTNLANASSGQQEALPMLLILKTLPFIFDKKTTFFIEEPEAHLFPVSQKQIVSLTATIYRAFGHSFFITTHSPYILTAINNLVVGRDAYDKVNGDEKIMKKLINLKKLTKLLPADELIRLEDVSAYTLNKGKLESIIDMENRLIGANLLDSVSDEFEAAFSIATEILYGDD
jgi:predicted ATPase